MPATISRHHRNDRLSRIVTHQGTVYLSGLTADDKGLDTRGQTTEVLRKAGVLLSEAGTDRSRLLFVQIWLRDIGDFEAMNEAWKGWIDPENPPARATVGATFAHPDIRVEIQFTAAL